MARVNYSPQLKIEAQKLREAGLSYGAISQRIKIVKSTARRWCKDIVLSPTAKKQLYTAGIVKMTIGIYNARNRRLQEIEKILKKASLEINEPINASSFKLLGAMTYWAEGAKYGQVKITNSDPLLIRFMTTWMCHVFNTTPNSMKANLNLYSQQDEKKIKFFWSEITGIPLSNFGKSFTKPVNKNYKKNTLYYGTISVRLLRSGDSLHRIFGWIRKFLEDIEINTGAVITRWNSLKTDYGRRPFGLSKKQKMG